MRHSFSHSVFDNSNFKTYHATCHCGAIRFDADVSPPLEADHEVVTCNCSMCFRTGSYNVYTPISHIRFTKGEAELKSYRYLSSIQYFCPNCGVQMTSMMSGNDGIGAGIVSVNVRTFLGLDHEMLKVRYADMKNEPPLWNPGAVDSGDAME